MFNTQLEKQADELENEIASCQDIDYLDELAETYGRVNHPQIGYRIGEMYLILDYKERGVEHLINSACFGLDPRNEYLVTGYANSIGHSIWYLIKHYNYKQEFDEYKYKLYCTAYFILSQCIAGMGNSAYNSLRTRALMIDNFDQSIVNKVLAKYYYSGDDLCTQMLSMSDYFYASLGFRDAGENKNSSKCLKSANGNIEHMLTLPQYASMKALDIESIADFSKKNQDHLVKKLVLGIKSGHFQISSDDLRQAISNCRITASGFSLWA